MRPLRHCLRFAFFNTITWQIALSTPLVLFAEQLLATSGQIGVISSLVLLLTPIQILSTVLLPRLGYKRLMLSGWGIRSFLLLVPISLALVAPRLGVQPWMMPALIGAVFVFCVFRAIGLAATLPWFYAIIPPVMRGRYFASESAMAGVASVLILAVSAGSFALMPIYAALALQFGFALAGSVWSWLALRKLPEGPTPQPTDLAFVFRSTPRLLFTPSSFRRYLSLSLGCAIFTAPIAPFVAYYLKSEQGFPASWIMVLEILRYIGMVGAAHLISRRIELVGARPYMLAALALYLVLGAYWLVRLQGFLDGGVGLVFTYGVLGMAATCWGVGNANYLPKVAFSQGASHDHTLILALHGAFTALAGGLATLGWGWLLRPADGRVGLDHAGFTVLFVCVLAGAAWVSYRLARRPEPEADAAEPLMVINTVLRPWRAAAYLINLTEPLPRVPAAKAEAEAPTP